MLILEKRVWLTSLTTIAACVLAACGGGNDGSSGSVPVTPPPTNTSSSTTYSGVVAASGFVPGSSTGNPTLKAGYYQKATVFVDSNGNGVLDSGEASAVTDASGKFTLTTTGTGPLVADIGTGAINTATGAPVASHLILRASAEQIADQGVGKVVISPLSSEAQRLVEANGSSYAAEKANLAARLNGPAFNLGTAAVTDPLADVNTLSGATQYAALYQDNELTNRYTYATTKLDRKDLFPDNLAVAGGDPRLVGLTGVTLTNRDGSNATPSVPTQKQAPITFAQAQQAAFNVEGVPAYDNIFVVIEENKSTDVIVGNSRAVNINYILNKYNQLSTYYSTGNPSEPNYTALGGGDDFGITDDNWFGCGAVAGTPYAVTDVAFTGGTASDGQPLPAQGKLPPATSASRAGYSAASTTCGDNPTGGTVHNIPGDNLFTLMSKTGRTIRTYSESMNPGQDVRADSIADPAITATYDATNRLNGFTNLDGSTPNLAGTPNFGVVNGLYKVKHGPSIAYQSARNLPEFAATNRTIFGTQYQEADWLKATAYPVPSGWVYDQFSKDLATGDVGNINFIVPDQCDDMHGVGSDTSCVSNNNGQANGVMRADIYLGMVVKKIQSSALWKNPNKRVAIVVMYDEGEGGSNGSCCGWNAGGKNSGAAPVTVDANGKATATAAPSNYAAGNFGHGNSIFGIISNQQDVGTAKKNVADSDAYSHFSFVRTLQDMFQIADPAVDASYLNRAKYTEAFITANITALPEFAGSADTHFDSVRPINHAYVIPGNYTQKLYAADIVGQVDTLTGKLEGQITPQVGPDASQTNVWATH
ncbi:MULTISPECIES: phosphoesterase [unclassified Variovorax]|uniref:phosphoesterase n=1 Tax=unclassified Variovorax TaxID=663243 RepID=UPI002574ABBD|nr:MULTISPECIES: phosphoesterase [unclassified Variovorax]MDM0088040.1 phosphoesterase [Variovorax sp. J22G40]MDM0146113.1 phosphoesterase [Variovorax sp. J2P1-31]